MTSVYKLVSQEEYLRLSRDAFLYRQHVRQDFPALILCVVFILGLLGVIFFLLWWLKRRESEVSSLEDVIEQLHKEEAIQ